MQVSFEPPIPTPTIAGWQARLDPVDPVARKQHPVVAAE
jgi:hypothetical protein